MSATFNRSHRLIVNVADAEDLRRDPSRSTYEAHCSCGMWKAHTDKAIQYRELHGAHLDEYLGPDAVIFEFPEEG